MNSAEKEAEVFFRQLALVQDKAINAYQHINAVMDGALAIMDRDAMWSLIPYIENGDGQLAFQYIGKTRRIWNILNILTMEEEYNKILLCQDCRSMAELRERYMLTLFALRRLLFRLSAESFDEAAAWLQSHSISYIAVYVIICDERLIPDEAFYETLIAVFSRYWSEEDIQCFCELTAGDTAYSRQEEALNE